MTSHETRYAKLRRGAAQGGGGARARSGLMKLVQSTFSEQGGVVRLPLRVPGARASDHRAAHHMPATHVTSSGLLLRCVLKCMHTGALCTGRTGCMRHPIAQRRAGSLAHAASHAEEPWAGCPGTLCWADAWGGRCWLC
jgi:hypothetical protein